LRGVFPSYLVAERLFAGGGTKLARKCLRKRVQEADPFNKVCPAPSGTKSSDTANTLAERRSKKTYILPTTSELGK